MVRKVNDSSKKEDAVVHHAFRIDFPWFLAIAPLAAIVLSALLLVVLWIRWCINDELAQENRCTEARKRSDL